MLGASGVLAPAELVSTVYMSLLLPRLYLSVCVSA